MKKVVLVVLVAAATIGFAQAAELGISTDPATTSTGTPYQPRLPNITQNTDPGTVEQFTGVACGTTGVSTAENFFLRRYFLNADHGITLQYNVTSVDAGIESVQDNTTTGTVPFDVQLFRIDNGAAFTFANMTLIGQATVPVADASALVIVNFPATGSILDPMAQDLVAALHIPDAVNDEYIIFPGANASGQLQPSYIAASACGLGDPLDYAAIGFPDCMLVQTVNGDEQVVPTPTPDTSGGNPVPTMNRYGVIAMVVLLLGVAILVISRRN